MSSPELSASCWNGCDSNEVYVRLAQRILRIQTGSPYQSEAFTLAHRLLSLNTRTVTIPVTHCRKTSPNETP